MKKLTARRLLPALASAALAMTLALPVGALAQELVPVGETVGIEAETDGLLVASLSKVQTASGEASPAADGGVLPGDIIVRVGKTPVSSAEDFAGALSALDGGEVELTVLRDEKTLQLGVTPARDAEGAWRLGLWLRGGVSGVLLPIREGSICDATVSDVLRGERGRAGELHGSYDAAKPIGTVRENTAHGIFGSSDGGFEGEALPVAEPGEIEDGPAVILANVSGDETREYAVEISALDSDNERLLVTVTDPALLEATGGIVQGMSGSPIIQNGKLAGAVTHVSVSH